MKMFLLSIIVFLSFHSSCLAQEKIIEIGSSRDNNGDYYFYCLNHDFCNYTIIVNFPQIYNLTSIYSFPHNFDVTPGRNQLFVLKRNNQRTTPSFLFSFKTIKGGLNPKIKSDFVYLLPVGNGKETQTIEMKYFSVNENEPKPKDWYEVALSMKNLDTIYAARGGIVTGISDTTNLKLSGYTYSSYENFIEIYHDDCTFGRYNVFSKILVKKGQKVFAGDPIGLAGGEKYITGPNVRFSVQYNYELPANDEKNKEKNKEKNNSYSRAYVPLVFYTKEYQNTTLKPNTKYTAEYPESIITQEMSKRQIKLRQKNAEIKK